MSSPKIVLPVGPVEALCAPTTSSGSFKSVSSHYMKAPQFVFVNDCPNSAFVNIVIMNRTKSENELARRGQLGRFRKVSKQVPQAADFFGVEQEQAKPDVHGIPEWETPMKASGGQEKMPVKFQKPQSAPSRKVERQRSAPVYKQTAAAVSDDAREIAFNPPPTLPQRASSRINERKQPNGQPSEKSPAGNRKFENMFIECSGNDCFSIGDLTSDTFESTEPRLQQPSMKTLRRSSSPGQTPRRPLRSLSSPERIGQSNSCHGAGVAAGEGGVGVSHHGRPLSAFRPRRTISPAPPRPSSSARTIEEEEEERMIQLAMERSLHEAKASKHTRLSTFRGNNASEHSEESFASQISNNSSHSLSSAGCHLSMIAKQMKRESPDGCGVQPSNRESPIDPSFVWRKTGKRWMKIHVDDLNTNDNLHGIQEQHAENNNPSNSVARPPACTTTLNPELAMRRLRELEQEKRMLEQTMGLSMAAPLNVASDSPTSMRDEEVVNELQEEELLAEALKRSMQEM